MATSMKALVIARTREYLALAARDPEQYPIKVKRIAAFVPCARGLFYKTEAETVALMKEIEAAQQQRPTATATEVFPGGLLAPVSDADLEADIEEALKRATWTMQRFIGFQQRSSGAAEAALAVHDLDTTLVTLRLIRSDLDPLVTEYQRRQRATFPYEKPQEAYNEPELLVPEP